MLDSVAPSLEYIHFIDSRRYSRIGEGVQEYVGCIHRFCWGRVFDSRGDCIPVLEIQTEVKNLEQMSNNSTALQSIAVVERQILRDVAGSVANGVVHVFKPAIEKGSRADQHGACSVFVIGDLLAVLGSIHAKWNTLNAELLFSELQDHAIDMGFDANGLGVPNWATRYSRQMPTTEMPMPVVK